MKKTTQWFAGWKPSWPVGIRLSRRVRRWVIILCVLFLYGHAAAVEKPFPFAAGEKMTFVVKWTVIPAGFAEVEVLPVETIHGVESYHFVFKARTTEWIDKIYRVRERIDAFANKEMKQSILYIKDSVNGKKKRYVTVRFDWREKKAHYTNAFRKKKRKPVSIIDGTFDPLSAFYYCRMIDLQKNNTIECSITDGKKCVMGRARVIRRETIRIESGTYDTFLIKPELKHLGGVFKKSKKPELEVWVTADERRIPVKLRSKVLVGSFTGELVSATPVNN
jgi:hypothetical protein